ncbi:MAG: YSIRK-type signal peptide-containing protein [Lactobacillus sp.]|jgi:hypothetical protein|nr:YSIRK-type signal peptide-containing protein [Lactobacillus sp.]
MLKNKKTQFAIRKLTTGTAAILLSLTCLGGTASSALADQTSSEVTVDTGSDDSSSEKTSNIYTLKIEYWDNSKSVGTAYIKAKDKTTIKSHQIKHTILNNVPQGYELWTKPYVVDVKVDGQDPDPIHLKVRLKDSPTQTETKTFNRYIHITYPNNSNNSETITQSATYSRKNENDDWKLNGGWSEQTLKEIPGYQVKVRYEYDGNKTESSYSVNKHDFPTAINDDKDLPTFSENNHVYVTYEPITPTEPETPETPEEPEVPVKPEEPEIPDTDNDTGSSDSENNGNNSNPGSSNSNQSSTTLKPSSSTTNTLPNSTRNGSNDSQFTDMTSLPLTNSAVRYASLAGITLTIFSIGAAWFISRKEKE